MARSHTRNQDGERNPLEQTRKKRKQNAVKHRPRFNGPAHRKEHKINPLKSRIRDLTRLLSKVEDMPADVRSQVESDALFDELNALVAFSHVSQNKTFHAHCF